MVTAHTPQQNMICDASSKAQCATRPKAKRLCHQCTSCVHSVVGARSAIHDSAFYWISLFGALRVSTGIRPSVPIIAVLHTAVFTSISSRSGHSHAMPSSRSALCARSSCTCKMVWPERRAGVKPSLKCFVRITSMLAVQWHATKRAWCATVLFIHHCDASTHRRLQSW